MLEAIGWIGWMKVVEIPELSFGLIRNGSRNE